MCKISTSLLSKSRILLKKVKIIVKNHDNVCIYAQKIVSLRKISNIKTKKAMKRELLPKHKRMLSQLGEQIRMARLRRDLSSEQVAERAGIARNTLIKIENGDEGVAIGSYFRVLIVLGLEEDLLTIASDDVLGRKLQDAGLKVQKRATKQLQG